MVIPFSSIMELNSQIGLISELKEKVYAYADFLPPGKHNTCFLYNTTNRPKKGLYTFLSNVNHRELPLDLSNFKYLLKYSL
jgi:hypothetical protein